MQFFDAHSYQAQCQQRFEDYQKKILDILPNAHVEHIGSSAIPHAISKGDLDIYIGVEATDLDCAIVKLQQLNFAEKKNTLRTANLCMMESKNGDDVAFQVVVKGSEFENFLIFRDQLRKIEHLVAEYNHLKRNCVGFTPIQYRKVKAAFIQQVLAQTNP